MKVRCTPSNRFPFQIPPTETFTGNIKLKTSHIIWILFSRHFTAVFTHFSKKLTGVSSTRHAMWKLWRKSDEFLSPAAQIVKRSPYQMKLKTYALTETFFNRPWIMSQWLSLSTHHHCVSLIDPLGLQTSSTRLRLLIHSEGYFKRLVYSVFSLGTTHPPLSSACASLHPDVHSGGCSAS